MAIISAFWGAFIHSHVSHWSEFSATFAVQMFDDTMSLALFILRFDQFNFLLNFESFKNNVARNVI